MLELLIAVLSSTEKDRNGEAGNAKETNA
jgi:hypothetical protein